MDADQMFLTFGMEYYVAARASVLAQQTIIPANLFHHAIENLLKAYLSRTRSLDQLKKQFGHVLPKTWAAFRNEVKDATLTQFDNTIEQLHAFEDIRYPDRILKDGATIVIGGWASVSPASTPKYSISVDEVDRLVAAILKASSRNPTFFTNSMNGYARDALIRDNPVAEAFLERHELRDRVEAAAHETF
jgi:hypothetical protein